MTLTVFESDGLSLVSSALITVNEKYRVLLEFENAAAKPAEVNVGYIKINNLVVLTNLIMPPSVFIRKNMLLSAFRFHESTAAFIQHRQNCGCAV